MDERQPGPISDRHYRLGKNDWSDKEVGRPSLACAEDRNSFALKASPEAIYVHLVSAECAVSAYDISAHQIKMRALRATYISLSSFD